MVVLGKDEPRLLPSASLDAKALVRLVKDIFYVRGCSDIRLTDGPGDDGRDVHAIDAEGAPLLAQCKGDLPESG